MYIHTHTHTHTHPPTYTLLWELKFCIGTFCANQPSSWEQSEKLGVGRNQVDTTGDLVRVKNYRTKVYNNMNIHMHSPALAGGRRQWHPTPVLLPGESHGQRSLVGCSPWGFKELDTTEWLHFHVSLSCIGEGNGNPLQCSCLENPWDGGAGWAAVCGVAQSRTRMKRLSSSSSIGKWILYHCATWEACKCRRILKICREKRKL